MKTEDISIKNLVSRVHLLDLLRVSVHVKDRLGWDILVPKFRNTELENFFRSSVRHSWTVRVKNNLGHLAEYIITLYSFGLSPLEVVMCLCRMLLKNRGSHD